METIEHSAKITLAAEMAGEPALLSNREVAKLMAARPRYLLRLLRAACGATHYRDKRRKLRDDVTLTRSELDALIDEAVRKRPHPPLITDQQIPSASCPVCVYSPFLGSLAVRKCRHEQRRRFFQVIQAETRQPSRRMLAAEPELATARNEKGQSALLLTIYGGNKELRDTLLASGAPLEVHEAAALGI